MICSRGLDLDRDTLKERTRQLALRSIRLVEALPRNVAGRALGAQLVRSATSVGANYRAACRSRSRKEFSAKIGVVTEEADETAYWLELVAECGWLKPKLVEPLLQEANELTAIFARTRKSTLTNINKSKINKSTNNP